MLDLACDRTPPRVKVAATAVACTLQLAVVLTLVLLAGFLGLPVWARLLLIGTALCSFAAVLVPVLLVAVNTERFTCPHCGKVFVPTLRAYVFGLHTLRKRHLKCPHCGKRGGVSAGCPDNEIGLVSAGRGYSLARFFMQKICPTARRICFFLRDRV